MNKFLTLGFSVVLSAHILRNALIPVITVIGLQVGLLMAGVETKEAAE